MDSQTLKEEVEGGLLPPIYYCNITVAYKKGKKRLSTHERNIDIVSRYNTPTNIHKDELTMNRIEDFLYGSAYKGQKHIMVRSVNSYKVVGYVNSNAI